MEKNPELRHSLDRALAEIENARCALAYVVHVLTKAGRTAEAHGIERQRECQARIGKEMLVTYTELCALDGESECEVEPEDDELWELKE